MIKAKAENDALQLQTEVQQLLFLSPLALPGAINSSDNFTAGAIVRNFREQRFICRSQTCVQVCVWDENKCDAADFSQLTDTLPIFRNSSVNLSGSICHPCSQQINEQLLFARMDLLMPNYY